MYQAVFVSDPKWEELSPLFERKDDAEKWLNRQIMWSGKPRDGGYVMEFSNNIAA